jgi:membrane associated rhomboid family serine protease
LIKVGDRMALKEETATLIGLLSLALGFVLKDFADFEYSGFSVSAFIGGVLTGLSVVMCFYSLMMRRRK